MVNIEYIAGCAIAGLIIYHGYYKYKNPSLKKYFNHKIEKSIRIGQIITGINIFIICLLFLLNN